MTAEVWIALAGLVLSILASAAAMAYWGGGIHVLILEAERRAKHDAVNQVAGPIADIQRTMVTKISYEDLVRRVRILEKREGLNGG